MTIPEIIEAIRLKHEHTGITINPPVSIHEIEKAEKKIGFVLPPDFKEFYFTCNGFSCKKDAFYMLSAKNLFTDNDFGENCMIFADQQVFTNVWVLRKTYRNEFEIFYDDGKETILTNSLLTFLEKLLQGHVSDPGGLHDWRNKLMNSGKQP